MISFRHRSNVKRIKIKTHKKLDERMSFWLQKVFTIKNPIIGFKSIDNKYYDVETFYMLIEQFYNSQVEIVEGTEQAEISFTSDNLNSSSFIRPSQPNTSEINHKAVSEEDDIIFVNDMRAFERRLPDNRELSVLFDIHPGYKSTIVDSIGDINNPYSGVKMSVYVLVNNHQPKKSNFSIYIGRTNVVSIPLTTHYKKILLNAVSKAKNLTTNYEQNRNVRPQVEDQAPSFTTHHLQQRLNQDACFDYLSRMNRERLLSNYEYHKLLDKVEQNFSEFYRIFCQGVLDNDYESFKNEIRMKVENNLEMLLSNVEEMDLSRPISRQEQRRQNLKKAPPEIQIVKVENYFEVLDLIKDRLDPKYLGQIKQSLLDEHEQIQVYFSRFIARQYGKEQLSKKLTAFAKEKIDDLRPISRCVPRAANRARSSDNAIPSNKDESLAKQQLLGRFFLDAEEAPMFGSLNIKPVESVFSPIKNMSDIQSIYKTAWDKLSKKTDYFEPEEYGLLYHYLQTRDDIILNEIQSLENFEESSLQRLKDFLIEKISLIMAENFTEAELFYLDSVRNDQNISYIFENFKYECDIHSFLSSLREQINKGKGQDLRILNKKSSDSQLLQKNAKQKQQRKYSDENNQNPVELSPKASQMSLYQKGSQFSLYNLRLLNYPWNEQFEEMLKFCNYGEPRKEQYLRSAYLDHNPELFLWVRQFIKNKETRSHSSDYFRQNVQKKDYENKGLQKILPLYCELLKEFEREGKITDKMRKWAVISFMQCSVHLIAAFEVYILSKDETQFIDSIKIAFENDDKQMELYKLFTQRVETLLKEMCVHNEASLHIFKQYPTQIRSFIDVFFFCGNFQDLMENLDLLQTQHVEKSKMNIATLNFSGVNTNPFEYDDGSEMFDEINKNVQHLISQEFPDLKDWQVGKIDKDFTANVRLSVGFTSNMDSIDGRLLNREQYATIWRKKFEQFNESNPKPIKPSEQEITTNIAMDFVFYRALVKYLYQIATFEELQQTIQTLPYQKLNQFLQKQHNRPASKLDIKENMVIEYLIQQRIDVLCMQEAGSIDWKQELIPGYAQHKNHDSVILYNKEKIGNIRTDLMDQYGPKLDFNSDSAWIFTDKNFLIMSIHLKAKKINLQQAKEMFTTLRAIKAAHPLLKIVLGMDSNHFLETQNLFNQEGQQIFFIKPDVKDKPTTIKKRTFMQAQLKKAGLAVKEVKDHIATTNQIVQARIEKVNGEESTDELLPNDSHPYDHYIVKSVIKFL